MRHHVVGCLVCLGSVVARAQTPVADSALKVSFGGFVDTYYAYDFRRPPTLDRALTTQAARHNEFNVNLAFVDATLTGSRLRGRFAAQFGTSVQANYAGEPRLGVLSGPDVSRFIQEATAGYQVAPTLWIDGGVFFSPFGSENWISRDNWTYTRSLIAENSPYYEAGVKATWQATPTIAAQLHIINGWQNISETNSDKAFGGRLDLTPKDAVAVSYDVFVGNEQPDSLPSRIRLWHEGVLQLKPAGTMQLRATFDLGSQERASGGSSWWRGGALIARYQINGHVAAAGRAEYYSDPDQVIISTGHSYGVRVWGGSLNTDVALTPRLLWRIELRSLSAHDPLFPDRSSRGLATTDPVCVTSLALTF
jgi:hypothetical protein